MSLKFFATCPKGLEGLLFTELKSLGFNEVKETVAGVSCCGNFQDGMKACLWSRFASRFMLKMSDFFSETDTELYMGANGVAWENWFSSDNTIAVDFSGSNDFIRNTQYGAQKVKDAICDRLQKVYGHRPYVDKVDPDIRIYCHLEHKGEASIYIDLSGRALLKREYHRATGAAPLKENLASAMVVRSGYKEGCFCDPLCGSGTLLLEAASLLTDRAPGIKRSFYGFFKLKNFDEKAWQDILSEAILRSKNGLKNALEKGYKIVGFDRDPNVVHFAQENAKKAGFSELIEVYNADLLDLKNPFKEGEEVTIVTNPPYGKRLGNFNELIALYTLLGEKLKQNFKGGKAAVISSEVELLSCLRLHADKIYKLFNGELACQLRVFKLNAQTSQDEDSVAKDTGEIIIAQDFANRLKKNLSKIGKWAQKANIDCYRVYDADIPEYAAAIDYYAGRYVISAYAPPKSVNPVLARRHVLDMLSATISVTKTRGEDVILKNREVKTGNSQYEKALELKNEFITVNENGLKFKVNLEDYLDTGLFLDSRNIREIIRQKAKDKDFFNLFSYTSTASVAAAVGGAKSTVSVDMSRTYLSWGRENFELNNLKGLNHEFIQADCLSYLSTNHNRRYDLIYLDPPTFSNSKRMAVNFDVKRDHVKLLGNLTRHLKDGGEVIFCTNCRDFKLDEDGVKAYGYEFTNISDKTLPFDFARNKKIHTCFSLIYKESLQEKQPEAIVEVKFAPKWQKVMSVNLDLSESESPYNKVSSKRGLKQDRQDRDFDRPRRCFTRDDNRFDREGKLPRRNSAFNKSNLDAERKPKAKVRVWGPDGVKDL